MLSPFMIVWRAVAGNKWAYFSPFGVAITFPKPSAVVPMITVLPASN